MQQFHFPTEPMKDVRIEGFGHTEDGNEAVLLTGGVVLTTDNPVALAAFLTGIGSVISAFVAQRDGVDALLAELEALSTGAPFEAPELSPPLPFPSAPDIAGRDL